MEWATSTFGAAAQTRERRASEWEILYFMLINIFGDYFPLIFPMLQICLDVNGKTADLRKLELRGAEQLPVSIILIL